MKWVKTPPEVIAKFDAAAPKDPRVVRKPMFGYPALYLNGNMFAGTYQDRVVVRLSGDGRAEAARQAKAVPFEPMPGRPMREYVVLPKAVVARPAELRKWIEGARDYAAGLPAKATGGRGGAKTKRRTKP